MIAMISALVGALARVGEDQTMLLDPEEIQKICALHGLTEKQTQFVVAYVNNGRNATAAYRSAYSVNPKTKPNAIAVESFRQLRHPKIRAVLDEFDEKVRPAVIQRTIEITAINEAWVKQRLVELVLRFMHGAPVLDADGNPMLVVTSDGRLAALYGSNENGALKGLELLGRSLGMWDRKALEPPVPPEVQKIRDQNRARMFAMLREFEKGKHVRKGEPDYIE